MALARAGRGRELAEIVELVSTAGRYYLYKILLDSIGPEIPLRLLANNIRAVIPRLVEGGGLGTCTAELCRLKKVEVSREMPTPKDIFSFSEWLDVFGKVKAEEVERAKEDVDRVLDKVKKSLDENIASVLDDLYELRKTILFEGDVAEEIKRGWSIALANSRAYKAMFKELLEVLDVRKYCEGGKVLNPYCVSGYGSLSIALASNPQEVVAFFRDPAYLKLAEGILSRYPRGEKVKPVLVQGYRLPSEYVGYFDCVVAIDALDVLEPEWALVSIWDSLKKDGRLFVVQLRAESLGALYLVKYLTAICSPIDPSSLARAIADVGFRVELSKLTESWYAARYVKKVKA